MREGGNCWAELNHKTHKGITESLSTCAVSSDCHDRESHFHSHIPSSGVQAWGCGFQKYWSPVKIWTQLIFVSFYCLVSLFSSSRFLPCVTHMILENGSKSITHSVLSIYTELYLPGISVSAGQLMTGPHLAQYSAPCLWISIKQVRGAQIMGDKQKAWMPGHSSTIIHMFT